MATKVADRVLLDTNVLLAASDTGRQEHAKARDALDEWPAHGTALYCSGQVLREYLAVATRPQDGNGLGLNQKDAVANARAFSGRLRVLAEDEKVRDRLLALLGEVQCAGKQVHDANVVATMLAHGIETIATLNVDDFVRFEGYIKVMSP